ncbi:hypothetical protein [Burkholderia cepacia]|uniref:hypothetical protein n=1 Tax=Burkholderia cepacia TaxID=292 RepID=UPI002AB6D980|nr:hypothetical protein [Burkholderia cepacia]
MTIKIPVYQSQVTPTLQTSGARAPLVTVEDGVGSALEKVGGAIGRIADEQQKLQDSQDLLAAQKTYADTVAGYQQGLVDMQGRAAPGAPEFTRDAMSAYDESVQGALSSIQNPRVRTFMDKQYTEYRQKAFSTALGFEAEQQRKFAVSNTSDAINASASASARDPSQYVPMLAGLNVSIDNSILPPDVKATLRQSAKDTMSSVVGMRMVSDNPALAYSVLTQKPDQPAPAGFEWVNDLPPQKLSAFQNHARALVAQQQNAADRAQLAADNAAVDARNKAIDIWMKGQQFSPDYVQQLTTIAKGTSEEQSMHELIALAGRSAGFASMSLPQQQAEIDRMHTKASTAGQGVDTIESKYIDQIQTMHSQAVTDYKANPWEAAASRGAIPALQTAPITNEQDAIQLIKSRAGIIGSVEAYGPGGSAVSPLQPIEAKQLGDYLERLPAAQRGQAINDIGFSIGNADRIGALANQMDPEHRIDRLALLAGASQLTAQNGQRISSLIYQGAEAIRDKRAGIDDKLLQGVTALASAQLREAFPSATAAQDAIDTTKYLYAYGAAKNNVSNAAVDTTQLNASISGATGGVVDLNGRKTLKPYGWADDRFNAAVKAADATNIVTPLGDGNVYIGQTEVPAADFAAKLPSARLVRVSPQGVYAVTAGTGYATNAQKQPILIRLK